MARIASNSDKIPSLILISTLTSAFASTCNVALRIEGIVSDRYLLQKHNESGGGDFLGKSVKFFRLPKINETVQYVQKLQSIAIAIANIKVKYKNVIFRLL